MSDNKTARAHGQIAVIGVVCVSAALAVGDVAAASDRDAPERLRLEGAFGAVSVQTDSGELTNLRLREPDGSLAGQALSFGPIGTSVVDANGRRYESHHGDPGDVTLSRGADGRLRSVTLHDIRLRPSSTLTPVMTGSQPGSWSSQSMPNSLAFSRDGGTAYATNFADGSITPFDPATGETGARIAIDGGPSGIVVAPNGNLFVAVTSFATGGGSLVEVDPGSGRVLNTVAVGDGPQFPAITPDGKTVLVPNHGSDSVSVVDVDSASVRKTIAVGPGPATVAMAPGGKRAFVTNLGVWDQLSLEPPATGSDTVTPLDLGSMQALPAITVGNGPVGAAVTPDGRKLVVSLSREHAVVLVDTATGAVSKRIDVGLVRGRGFPTGLTVSPDGSTAYVFVLAQHNASSTSSVVSVDLSDGTTERPFPLVPSDGFGGTTYFPNGVALSPDGRFLLSTAWNASAVNRYDLRPPSQPAAPVTEDWRISVTPGGSLRWQIDQHWSRSFSGTDQAQPTIPFAPDVVSTLWYQPNKIISRTQTPLTSQVSEDFFQVLDDTDTWATYKLWSPYHLQSDLELAVDGGYLTRYQSRFGTVGRAGARFERDDSFTVQAGERRQLTVDISSRSKYDTGYQLDAEIPDRSMLGSLRDLYGSLLNSGVVADQGRYWHGDHAAGLLYADSALLSGRALASGVPSRSGASEHEHSVSAGYRGFVKSILESVDDEGKIRFGFSAPGLYGIPHPISQDQGLQALLGLHHYVVHSGDLEFFRQHRNTIGRMLGLWTSRIDSTGLVLTSSDEGNHYDQITCGNTCYDTYIQTLVYEVLKRMSELERAVARGAVGEVAEARASARLYRSTARGLKRSINRELWTPDSPHGPMYADWLDAGNGKKTFVFMGSVQYPAIMFGVAGRSRARQMLATADGRLAELASENGYSGVGTLVNLWPIPEEYFRQFPGLSVTHPFGVYENGGMLLRETHDEVVARAMAGDSAGARDRLALFARQFDRTSWWGDNGASINGTMEWGSGEPYVYGGQAVPGALIRGLLGIRQAWDGLKVDPALPSDWRRARASVMHRGERYCVSIAGDRVLTTRGGCDR